MSKILVTYFSASGVTRGVAQNIADSIGGDFEKWAYLLKKKKIWKEKRV